MQWQDEGIVLGCRRAGENGAILELMTRGHGRHAGWVHGARSKRLAPVLQLGNTVDAVWRARIDDQLGSFTVEPRTMPAAALLASPAAMFGLSTLASHLRLLPERDPHPDLYGVASTLIDRLHGDGWGADFVHFELMLLAELGFGLDLTACAATGRRDDLAYVSPKTARAVSREAGGPYADRLLALPPFLTQEESAAPASLNAVGQGLRLAGFFLMRHVYDPRGLSAPTERDCLVAKLSTEGEVTENVSGMFSRRALAAADP